MILDDWVEPTKYELGPVTAYRSHNGFGWKINVGRRFQWRTRRGVTPARPHISRGHDEHCNRAIVLCLYPAGTLTVWWEPRWRETRCDTCKAESRAEGSCEECGSSPCACDLFIDDDPGPNR
ncbi:hypothetical protein Kisp02_54990 [Kineosporia sp. NBRC 101731]|nr:hypothetical protein Kisp02_54990 [Kineosporia sp. NBRC 101731]